MATDKKEEKELWIGFARDAAARYQMLEDADSNDELVDDMVEVMTKYADSMLDELDKRYGGSDRSSRRRPSARRERPEDPEEPEED